MRKKIKEVSSQCEKGMMASQLPNLPQTRETASQDFLDKVVSLFNSWSNNRFSVLEFSWMWKVQSQEVLHHGRVKTIMSPVTALLKLKNRNKRLAKTQLSPSNLDVLRRKLHAESPSSSHPCLATQPQKTNLGAPMCSLLSAWEHINNKNSVVTWTTKRMNSSS